MLPVFTHPLALFGLLALPVLTAIYVLRNRYRRQVISSLLLWLDPGNPSEGGPRIDRIQTPLLFFIEMGLLALLAAAAAGPYLPAHLGGRPLVVVLDDSYSMLAEEPHSPRAAALANLEKELNRIGRTSIRFVLAGDRPVLLGQPVRTLGEAKLLLQEWRCHSTTAALTPAITLATEVGGELAAILALSDHTPENPPSSGRIQWRSFGKSRGNVAIVNAARSYSGGVERCLIAVENLSAAETATTLIVEVGDPPAEVRRETLTLAPGATQPSTFQLSEDTPILRARIDHDALALDNQVTLLPAPLRPVRVQLSLTDPVLMRLTEKALRATRNARLVTELPGLVISDGLAPPERTGDTWVMHLSSGEEPVAYEGQFVMDRSHKLTDGLSLQGVVWSPGSTGDFSGTPIVMAGNTVLVTDSEDASGRHLVRLRLRHDRSSLLESPSWPVLMTNLLSWRASEMPGLNRSNFRLGEDVSLVLTRTDESVRVNPPSGGSRTLPLLDGRVNARAGQPGIHELVQGKDRWPFAVNAVARDESDLRASASGVWGDWLDETTLRLDYRAVAWIVLLVALALVAIHLLLVARMGREARG